MDLVLALGVLSCFGVDGAFMHPFCVCTVGLLLLADIFEWSWKKLAVSMSIMLVLWDSS